MVTKTQPRADFAAAVGQQSEAGARPDFNAALEGGGVVPQIGLAKVEPGNLNDPLMRLKLGAAKNIEEKLDAFQAKYGANADIAFKQIEHDGEPELVFTPDRGAVPYKRVDPGFFEENGFINEMMDILGEDGGAIIGGLAFTPWGGGVRALQAFWRVMGGETAGDMAQEGLQTAFGEELGLGKQQQEFGEIAIASSLKGVISAATGVVGEKLITGGRNLVSGGGIFEPSPRGKELTEAVTEIAGTTPPLHAVINQPIINRIAAQSQAVFPSIEGRIYDIKKSVVEGVDKLRRLGESQSEIQGALIRGSDEDRRALRSLDEPLIQSMDRLYQNARERMKKEALNSLGVKTFKDAESSANMLAKSLSDYERLSQAHLSKLFTRAESIEQPRFDYSEIIVTAHEMLLSHRTGKDTLNPKMAELLEKINKQKVRYFENAERIQISGGVGDDAVSIAGVKIAGDADGALEVTATDMLRAVDSLLFDFTRLPSDRAFTVNEERLANKFRTVVKNTYINPRNTNPRFFASYNQALSYSAERFSDLSEQIIVEAIKNDSPIELGGKLIRAQLTGDQYKAIFNVLDKHPNHKASENLRNVIAGGLVREFDRLPAALDKIGGESLRQIFKPKEIHLLKEYGVSARILESIGFREAREKHVLGAQYINELILENNTMSLSIITNMVEAAGGQNSPVGRGIRAAIADNIFNRAVKEEMKGTRLRSEALESFLKLPAAEMFLTRQDIRFMKHASMIDMAFIGSDTGASLMAGQMGAQMRGLLSGDVPVSARVHLLEAMGFGWLMVSPTAHKFFAGKGGAHIERTKFLQAAISTAQLAITSQHSADDIDAVVNKAHELSGAAVNKASELSPL